MLTPDHVAAEGPPCCFPGCRVRETGGGRTCVTWGQRRLCYGHYADYQLWSESVCRDRAPTPEEWQGYVAWSKAETVTAS